MGGSRGDYTTTHESKYVISSMLMKTLSKRYVYTNIN